MLFKNLTAQMRKSLAYGALGTLALGLCSETTFAQTKLIGYIPSYSGMTAVADRTDFTKLTHVNIAFLNPNASAVVASGTNPVCMIGPSGGNIAGSDISYIVNKAHAAGAKALISMAGGGIPSCAGSWQTLLANSRTTLVNNIVSFVNSANLDGVDIDIEGDLLTSIDNAGNYTPFIQALKNALPGKLVTAATASYVGGMIPTSSIQYFDFVNIMSYDAVGPSWGTAGAEHSPYSMGQSDITTWLNRGLPKSKLVLGVPFYGYGFAGMPGSISFNDIVGQYGAAAAQNDVIGTRCAGCAYITYNGIPTIRSKTTLAMQQGSGVMIWELSQDASGANSLLGVIRTQINSGGGTSSSSSSSTGTTGGSCVNWVSGNNYVTGNIVIYQSGYYIATHDNPGYNPTISTYFWSPTSSAACGGFTKLVEAESYSNMSGVQLEATSDAGGGQNVGWIDTGDWMSYANITIPTTGSYKIEYRVASVSGGTLAANLNTNAIQFPAVAVTASGGWQTWKTVSQTVTINAGTYTFGVYASAGGWNINWIKFTKQ